MHYARAMTSAPPLGTALRLTGRDALPLLHRISSNALADLAPGEARATLFCDFRGRLLHRAVVALAQDSSVWLLRDCAEAGPLAQFIDKHVFREQVAIADHSTVIAPGRMAADEAPGASFDEQGPLRVSTGDGTVLVRGAARMSDRERVALGVAAHGAEITEEFNPFEVGLGGEVHLTKGCFTGQEALQRLVTYDSVRRALVRGHVQGEAPQRGDALRAGEQRGGVITTLAPEGDAHAVLAVVKLEALVAAAEWTLLDGRSMTVTHRFAMPRAQGRP